MGWQDFYFVKEKQAARYGGYVTVTGFLWPDLGERFPGLAETLRAVCFE
jgi:hypothetical protein